MSARLRTATTHNIGLAALLLLQLTPWIAAVIAAIVGLCVTSLFFRPQRDAVARSFYEFRTAEHRDADSDAENGVLDDRAASSASSHVSEPRIADKG